MARYITAAQAIAHSISQAVNQAVTREIADLESKIETITTRVLARAFSGSTPSGTTRRKPGRPKDRRPLSAAARARIVAAQKARRAAHRERLAQESNKAPKKAVHAKPTPRSTRRLATINTHDAPTKKAGKPAWKSGKTLKTSPHTRSAVHAAIKPTRPTKSANTAVQPFASA